jgi:mRNA interferase RelE/StbE
MKYEILYNPEARRDLRKLSPEVARRIIGKIDRMADDLTGNVKQLKNFVPRYRLRVGDWRVLFEVEGARLVIHHVSHRSDVYE